MELTVAIETRISIREFTDEAVKLDDLSEIIRLAGLAPSINNYQPWKYYVITKKEILHQMAVEISNEIAKMPESSTRMAKALKNQAAWYSTFFHSAPMLIALAAHAFETDFDKGVDIPSEELDRMRNYPDLQSAGASIQNLLLAATSKDYGTCWMTGPLYAREKLEGMLKISEPWKLVSFVAIGKPAQKPTINKDKRDLSKDMVIL